MTDSEPHALHHTGKWTCSWETVNNHARDCMMALSPQRCSVLKRDAPCSLNSVIMYYCLQAQYMIICLLAKTKICVTSVVILRHGQYDTNIESSHTHAPS